MRIEAFDFLRGIVLMMIIFFHAGVFNYANINKLDFSNPPIVVVVISFLMLWGGLMIFYSSIINTLMILKRDDVRQLKFLAYAGCIYIGVHYLLDIFLGRWATDFVNNKPDMSVVAASIRNFHFTFPHISKIFDGSAVSTIAFNLIILSVILYFLLKDKEKDVRNYWILGISGVFIMLLSFVRVYIYPSISVAIEQHNYILATFLSFTIANPYPLLPYMAYSLFAVMIALMVFRDRKDLLKKVMIPIALFFVIYGVVGCLNFEKTISKADFFWYFKTQLELGIFIFINVLVLLVYKDTELKWASFIKNFSRITLTVYLLETTVSEIFGKILSFMLPFWNQTINGCLLFGFCNVLLWIVILVLWRKIDFRYSFEYFWVLFFNKIGKQSTKLQWRD